MGYKPLSDAQNRHLGAEVKTTTAADDEVADLAGGEFFCAERTDDSPESLPGLYYKAAVETVRRVRVARNGGFLFNSLPESASFRTVTEVLSVPEVDPRAWAATKDATTKPLPELTALRPGSFFTAFGAAESPSLQLRGVYRLGNDGMFRRLLKDQNRGPRWSDAIPSDRFGAFGHRLAVSEE